VNYIQLLKLSQSVFYVVVFFVHLKSTILTEFAMLTRSEILSYLRENKLEFRDQFGILKIGIFGSYAREEQTDQSDIDILIEMTSDTEDIFDKRLQLRKLLMKHFAKNVDICHEKAVKPIFKDLVFRDAIYA
jgi:hypothetical protein